MQLNQPYDPRYNAKIYVPKLTEEQRLARATPLEMLRRPKLQPAASVTDSRPQAVTTPLPQAQEASAPRETPALEEVPVLQDVSAPEEVPVSHDVPASHYIPTALEVISAEFPEIFAHQSERPLWDAHADDECLVSAGRFPLVPKLCLVEDAPGRRMQSPELRSATPPNQSSPQIRRSAPPDQHNFGSSGLSIRIARNPMAPHLRFAAPRILDIPVRGKGHSRVDACVTPASRLHISSGGSVVCVTRAAPVRSALRYHRAYRLGAAIKNAQGWERRRLACIMHQRCMMRTWNPSYPHP